jgi:hypothetical protein
MPDLTHSLGIVILVTLWRMCHFKFGDGVDISGEPFLLFVFIFSVCCVGYLFFVFAVCFKKFNLI